MNDGIAGLGEPAAVSDESGAYVSAGAQRDTEQALRSQEWRELGAAPAQSGRTRGFARGQGLSAATHAPPPRTHRPRSDGRPCEVELGFDPRS